METFETIYEGDGERLDTFVAAFRNISRSAACVLIEGGNVLVGGKTTAKKFKLKQGTAVKITLPDTKELDIEAEDIPLDIVYEDEDLLVVNKQKGMVVHPAVGNLTGTLVSALLHHCKGGLSGINGVLRPGIVHRIDKDTSGLLIVAKSDKAHAGLAQQIKEHSFDRCYEAVVYGNIKSDEGVINLPIGRHPMKRKQMAVTQTASREAVTRYSVISRYDGFTHIRLRLETGRTHQIRVHMAAIGHPVVGDPVYGPKKVISVTNGQCLHAKMIGFIHPVTDEKLEFESDLPDYFTRFLDTLELL